MPGAIFITLRFNMIIFRNIFQQKLEIQILENKSLKEELHKTRQEILTVKTRNKTLCNILGHGESNKLLENSF